MINKILIGDDREQVRCSLGRALRARKIEVDLAATAQEVIRKARANNYDAVITDLEYTEGGREGYEVLRQISDLPTLKVLYTAQSGFEFEAEGLECGADYVILRKDHSRLLQLLNEKLGDKNDK
jgi:DNA-binding response OmpR family regulator